jgi:hypothetical protein
MKLEENGKAGSGKPQDISTSSISTLLIWLSAITSR